MKRLMSVAVVCACLGVGVSARAAAESGADAGSLGLLFGFSAFAASPYDTSSAGGGLLGGLSGGTGGLGVKYMVIPNLGVRGMVGFGSASADIPANPQTGDIGRDGEISATSWGLGAGAEYYLSTSALRPYVGATLRYGSTSTEARDEVTAAAGQPLDAITVDNAEGCEDIGDRTFCGGSTLGASALLGVEFFPWENISFAAEYQLGYASTSRSDQKATLGTTTVTTKVGGDSGFGITSLGLLTLAIYFM